MFDLMHEVLSILGRDHFGTTEERRDSNTNITDSGPRKHGDGFEEDRKKSLSRLLNIG
jgi:hypothetical protein